MDSVSKMKLMKEGNSHQRDIIQILQLHETYIVEANKAIRTNSFKLLNSEQNFIKMAATLSITNKANEVIRMANIALNKAHDILSKGDSNRLSRHVINQESLLSILDKIYLRRSKTESTTVFSCDDRVL